MWNVSSIHVTWRICSAALPRRRACGARDGGGVWHIVCGMTHSCVWHSMFVCMAWPMQVVLEMCWRCGRRVTYDSCVTWLIHMCDMTKSYMRHGSSICDMTHSYMWHDWIILRHGSFICDPTHSYVTWLVHMALGMWKVCLTWFICDMTHLYVIGLTRMLYDSFIYDTTHSYVTQLIHMWHDSFICDKTHSYVTRLVHMWYDSFICDTTHSYVS